ncbi:MAG: glycosyltransferase, partial [Pontixanthobacter sp.]
PIRRVLSLSTLYPNASNPRFGTFVARSMEALAARGDWDVTMVNPIGMPPLAFGRYRDLAAAAKDGEDGGVHIHRPTFPLIPRFGVRHNPAIIARKVLPLVRRLHRDAPFDLVDAQFFYPDGPAALHIANALGLPCSIKTRGSDITFWRTKGFARRQICDAAVGAAGLLGVSEALIDDMVALGMPRAKIRLHRTGLDRDRFRPLDHTGLRTTLARRLDIALPADAPLFSCVGALIERKGQALAIEALTSFPDARLLLIGSGPDEALLKALVRRSGLTERVHFLGSVDHDVLPVILSASDAMVLPSSREGLANAWVEALACGTPIVVNDAGGARELVVSDTAGRIVARTPPAIAEGLQNVLAMNVAPEDVAATVDAFSWSNNAGELAAHYESLLVR